MKRSLKKLPLAKATTTLAEAAENLDGAALILTVKGKPMAALVPVEGMDWESLVVGTSPDFIDLIERSRRESREGAKTYSDEELRAEFGLPPYDPARAKANGRTGKPATPKGAGARKAKTKK